MLDALVSLWNALVTFVTRDRTKIGRMVYKYFTK